jgi:hypothetical protein
MKILDTIKLLNEAGRGSEKGRSTYTSKEGAKRNVSKSVKGRVRTYASIKKALSDAGFGTIFTTTGSGRLYVVSKGKWGKKSGRGKIAKGFTKGSATPSADFSSVKKHAARTLLRYGKASDALAKKYGSRSIRKSRGIGGKDGRLDKGK